MYPGKGADVAPRADEDEEEEEEREPRHEVVRQVFRLVEDEDFAAARTQEGKGIRGVAGGSQEHEPDGGEDDDLRDLQERSSLSGTPKRSQMPRMPSSAKRGSSALHVWRKHYATLTLAPSMSRT